MCYSSWIGSFLSSVFFLCGMASWERIWSYTLRLFFPTGLDAESGPVYGGGQCAVDALWQAGT